MQWLYLATAVLGAVLPLSFLFPFLAAHGPDLPLLFRQLFQNNVSSFFGVDVIVSAAVVALFVYSEGRMRRMRRLWVYIACLLLVGVSFALPLFLFARERSIEAEASAR
ncbi:MAG TPA: DUF2834 domain-containing protein [Pyrinomonadaceae bacterium]|nr:DUF2834 domain-containing protein [Pyrinomonadaceae bacterium]